MDEKHRTEAGVPGGRAAGMRVSWELNVGTVLQAGVLLVGLVIYLVTGQDKTQETQRNLNSLQQDVTTQIAELRAAVTGSLAEVRHQIDSLPDQRAQLVEANRRLSEEAQARAVLEARLGVVERATIELRSDLNNIMQASRVPLPGGRR